MAAAEEVEVDVRDFLTGVGLAVDDHSVAVVETELRGDTANDCEEGSDQRLVLGGDVIEGEDFGLGDDQDMNRGLRPDVAEGERKIVFVENVRRDFAVDDAAKDRGHGSLGDETTHRTVSNGSDEE